jgi:hypothetical protein
MLIMGVAAGFVWERLASPAEWEVRDTGIVLTEAASKGQFSVIAAFVLVGAVGSLVLGWFTGWITRDLGWPLTPLVIGLTVLGSLIAWRLGVHLGPPDPASVDAASAGDRIPSKLAIDGFSPFLVWPVFGLIGLIGSMLVGAVREPAIHPDV